MRELHRRNRRVLAELLHVQLIHRRADLDVGAFGQLRMRVRVHHRARAEVIAAHFGSRLRFRHPRVGVADDRQVIAERLERAEAALAEVEAAAGRGGIPEILRQRRTRCSRPRRAPARCRRGACGWRPGRPASSRAPIAREPSSRATAARWWRRRHAAPCGATGASGSKTSSSPSASSAMRGLDYFATAGVAVAVSASAVRNAALFTTPRISDDMR